jgi:hypothetical protein
MSEMSANNNNKKNITTKRNVTFYIRSVKIFFGAELSQTITRFEHRQGIFCNFLSHHHTPSQTVMHSLLVLKLLAFPSHLHQK